MIASRIPGAAVTGSLATSFVCAGCGRVADHAAPALRCTAARDGDDVDHVLRRRLEPGGISFPTGREANPFVRYRTLFHAYHLARAAGRSDAEIVSIIEELDSAVARVDGRGFEVTPLEAYPGLAASVGLRPPGSVLVKDETGNVSGSHKGRHLFGAMLGLSLSEAPGIDRGRPLAIASCGNAALAAAVVARAAEWPLRVFVPVDAEPSVRRRLDELGAEVTVCERRPGERGDPTYLRLRQAVVAGAIPFTCQGSENALALEGGLTLGYEIAQQLADGGHQPDRLFVQVGGGALASSVIQGLEEAQELGMAVTLPRIHAVQTEAAAPLARAHRLISEELPNPAAPSRSEVERVLGMAAHRRASVMWPWEHPQASVAHGILDDETYDWRAVIRGMLLSRGRPVIVDEATLLDANALARTTTPIAVDATGSAGLAGLLRLRRDGEVAPGETALVLFTGIHRNGESR